jgi:hypothetical protein
VFNKIIASLQLVATVAVVVVGALFVQQERRNVAESEGHSIARAYAVQLGQVMRGVEDMQHCEEKLLPFAEGPGARVAFSDLKLLGTFLTTIQLTTIDEASNELDQLFPSNYKAPPSSSPTAYQAWASDPGLQRRVQRVDELLGPTLRYLGSVTPRLDHCTRRQLLGREPQPRKPPSRKPSATKHQP